MRTHPSRGTARYRDEACRSSPCCALAHGHVQGVAFRHHTKTLAREIGLTGWVRNVKNGDVEAWVEGEDRLVDNFVRPGSKKARPRRG